MSGEVKKKGKFGGKGKGKKDQELNGGSLDVLQGRREEPYGTCTVHICQLTDPVPSPTLTFNFIYFRFSK